ncbi:MAG: DUF3368 domain-containing protein [Anaerolineales bacterium]
MIVVSDAGPLIALAKIGQFDLLRSLYNQLYIPRAVQDEVVASGQGRPGAEEVHTMAWIHTVEIYDTTAVQLLEERLDAGESESIVLAIQLEANLLLIDEARGRRVAEARGLNKTGTIGTLIAAKKRGLVSKVMPLVDNLRASGFRMGENLYRTCQILADE